MGQDISPWAEGGNVAPPPPPINKTYFSEALGCPEYESKMLTGKFWDALPVLALLLMIV